MPAVPCRHSPPRLLLLAASALLAGVLAGCATPPPADDPDAVADFRQTNDPLEPTNRVFYKINDGLDRAILQPVARAYRYVLPSVVRTGIHNVLNNLGAPVRLTNDILQGKPARAGETTMRFLINTSAGIGGLWDAAQEAGFPGHDTDFGLTLGIWGVKDGPFLFLPILGPSSPRDFTGFGVDIAIDPFTWIGAGTQAKTIGSWSRTGGNAIDTRSNYLDSIEQIKKTALDPYATFRSLYRQNRAAKLDEVRADKRGTVPFWRAQGASATAQPSPDQPAK